MITLALLAGIWSTTCIQTQMGPDHQGFVVESFHIQKDGTYEFKRSWFRDPKCSNPSGTDTESGTLEIGSKISSFFSPGNSYEANFSSEGGIDLGAIALKENDYIMVARGVKNNTFRNTMLSLFQYKKQP